MLGSGGSTRRRVPVAAPWAEAPGFWRCSSGCYALCTCCYWRCTSSTSRPTAFRWGGRAAGGVEVLQSLVPCLSSTSTASLCFWYRGSQITIIRRRGKRACCSQGVESCRATASGRLVANFVCCCGRPPPPPLTRVVSYHLKGEAYTRVRGARGGVLLCFLAPLRAEAWFTAADLPCEEPLNTEVTSSETVVLRYQRKQTNVVYPANTQPSRCAR